MGKFSSYTSATPVITDEIMFSDDPTSPSVKLCTLDDLRILLSASNPKAKMTRDAAQSIPDDNNTLVQFDNTDYAVGITATTGVAARFTITEAGKYIIIAYAKIPGIDDGEQYSVGILLNGGNVCAPAHYSPGTNKILGPVAVETLDLSVTDYIGMNLYQGSGDAQNTQTSAWTKPRMSVVKI